VGRLSLSLACGLYDRTAALQDGTIVPEGIDLTFVPLRPGELFRRQGRHAEFEASEFALSTLLMFAASGDSRFVAIPVFPSRAFRHSNIYVNSEGAVGSPADLAGKRVGVQEYQQTAAVWVRGLLREQYGVGPRDVDWYVGAYDQPGTYRERVPIKLPDDIRRHHIAPDQCLGDMLAAGEIDALIGAHPPAAYYRDEGRIVRLIRDYKEREIEYFRRTNIFPIMHVVVVRRDVYERNRWVAMSLYKAFSDAQQVGNERLTWIGALYASLPQLPAYLEESEQIFGPDPFAYGYPENQRVLEKFVELLADDGLAAPGLDVQSAFAQECLQGLDRM
jgi:4,5-dihydroxyphthalate decarboxylase